MITDKIKARHLDESLLELINKPSVSSWNDLTDRPFGEIETEIEKVYLDFNGDLHYDAATIYATIVPYTDILVLGESYNIIYNDVLYENCIAQEGSTINTIYIKCETENGYVNVSYTANQQWYDLAVRDNTVTTTDPDNILNVSVKVTGKAKENIIKRIDGKYLPEGYPYVEEGGMVEILPEIEIEIDVDGLGEIAQSIGLKVGETYIITYNGVSYTSIAIDGGSLNPDAAGQVLVGNVDLIMGLGDNGAPFVLTEIANEDMQGVMLIMIDGTVSTTVTLAIHQQNETIHTMDPKFLPLKFIEGSGAATNTLTFDGNLDGKECFQADEGVYFVRISDTFVDSSELIGGTVTVKGQIDGTTSSESRTISEDLIYDMSEEQGFPSYGIGELGVVLSQSYTLDGITISSGIWIIYAQDMFYVSELKAPKAIFSGGENNIILDPEYIKDMYYEKKRVEKLVDYTGTLGFDTHMLCYSPSIATDTLKVGENYTVIFNGVEYPNCIATSTDITEPPFPLIDSSTYISVDIGEGKNLVIKGLPQEENDKYGFIVYLLYLYDPFGNYESDSEPEVSIQIISDNTEIKYIDKKYLPTSIQSNWAENDENSISYIQNRPFYDKIEYSEIITDTVVNESTSNNVYGHWLSQSDTNEELYRAVTQLIAGNTYAIKINDTIYHCKVDGGIDGNDHEWTAVGNEDVIFGASSNGKYPFYLASNFDGTTIYWKPELGDTINITISNINSVPVPIDEKYLPDTVATKEFVTNEVDTLKKSVSDGKSLVAGAITDKGIITAADATFATMAQNISNIEVGVDTSDATASADAILKDMSAYVNGLKVTGTMPNIGSITKTLGANGSYTIPKGFHDGTGKVTQSLPTQAAKTWTPGTANQTIAAGTYLSGAQTIAGSSNLVASNIKSGVKIFGVTGTMTGIDSINGIVDTYLVQSGSNISAASFVSYVESIDTVISSTQATGRYITAAALTDTTVLVLYSGNGLNAVVCTISGNTITVGTAVTITALSFAGLNHSVVALSSTKAFIAFNHNDYLGGVICTISGTTITVGALQKSYVSTNSYFGGEQVEVVKLSSTSVFIAWNTYDSYYTRNRVYGVACTISDTTITFGAKTLLITASTYESYRLTATGLSSTAVFVAAQVYGKLYAVVCAISGTSITVGTNTNLVSTSSSSNVCGVSAVTLSSTKVFIAYSDANVKLSGIVCTISGTTITAGAAKVISTNSCYDFLRAIPLSATAAYILFGSDSSNTLYEVSVSISGTTITTIYETNFPMTTPMGGFPVKMGCGTIFVGFGYGTNSNRIVIHATTRRSVVPSDGSNNIVGLSKASGAAGGTIQIYVPS